MTVGRQFADGYGTTDDRCHAIAPCRAVQTVAVAWGGQAGRVISWRLYLLACDPPHAGHLPSLRPVFLRSRIEPQCTQR